jgi:hypothetical protein
MRTKVAEDEVKEVPRSLVSVRKDGGGEEGDGAV